MRLIIATKNSGKLREIKRILRGVAIPIVSLADLGDKFYLREDGKTFLANAIKKTKPVSLKYRSDLVVGEDSGLEVNALGGKPGIHSKRYSGPAATDNKNNLKLLDQLSVRKIKTRQARYRCCLVLMRSGKLIKSFTGELTGTISQVAKGKGGFGYDPLFYLNKYKKTVAQLPLAEKNLISHRAKAFLKLKHYLMSQRTARR